MLTREETERYARHLSLPEIGEEGQRRLKRASVLIIGAGGLGSPSAMYLAAAGVGRIGLVDFDRVDASNLQRQILYGESAIGEKKLDAAWQRLHDINRHIRIETFNDRLSSRNALDLFEPYDIVLDGTDNFPTRYLVNDACVLLGKANVYGSVFRFDGQAAVFDAGRGPCYRCVYPDPPPPHLVPSCAEGGVLGVLPGIVGTIQATEAIKLITGAGEPLIGRLLLVDALSMRFRTLKLEKNPQCRICGANREIRELIDYEEFCNPVNELNISAAELAQRLSNETNGEVVVIDVREPYEWDAGHLPEARHIPLQQVQRRIGEIPREAEIVMVCRSGGRSANAQQFLLAQGFKRVKNLVGGMIAWKRDVDPAMTVK
ncbi:MAG TPA: molybdopterin-synthase adenylyltransferase MoeB [Thermoanaerobaculia bacterium]|nr:molybdopterin-synthase adenylyltransferase MoeB [Thermoanaerobaculia bacterium]